MENKKTTIELNLNSLAVILYTSDLIPTPYPPLNNEEWSAVEEKLAASKRGDISALIGMNKEALTLLLDIDDDLADKMINRGKLLPDMLHSLHNLENEGILITTKYEDDYPEGLWKLKKRMPFIIYYMGDLGLINENAVSVVGPQVTNRALNASARHVIDKMRQEGRNLIATGGKGIDEYCVRYMLKSDGYVILFVADHMLDQIRENKKRIEEGRMLVMCAVDPYSYFDVTHALDRNIYVCGLSYAQFIIATHINNGAVWFTSVQNLHNHWTVPIVIEASPYYNGNPRLVEMGAVGLKRSELLSGHSLSDLIAEHQPAGYQEDVALDQMSIYEFIEE